MKRSVVETVLGAVVLLVALVFLTFSYKTANVGSASGYRLSANFSGIGGLKIGDDVQVSGVKVGQVDKIILDPVTFLAQVTLDIDPSIKVPEDTAAIISSQSLLGGRYLALEPGGSEETLPDGGVIQYTQAPQNLEQLLGQFIFSMSGKEKDAAAADNTTDAGEDDPASP
jgi:phospholipid/cholesterol/gamma-HCH transport system substrate-binding protein